MVDGCCCEGNQTQHPPIIPVLLCLLLLLCRRGRIEYLGVHLLPLLVVLLQLLVVPLSYLLVSLPYVGIAPVQLVSHLYVLHCFLVLPLFMPGHGSFEECLYILAVDSQGLAVDKLGTFPLLLIEATGSHVE